MSDECIRLWYDVGRTVGTAKRLEKERKAPKSKQGDQLPQEQPAKRPYDPYENYR